MSNCVEVLGYDAYLFPELLTNEQILNSLRKKFLRFGLKDIRFLDTFSFDELTELTKKYLMPKPQRQWQQRVCFSFIVFHQLSLFKTRLCGRRFMLRAEHSLLFHAVSLSGHTRPFIL